MRLLQDIWRLEDALLAVSGAITHRSGYKEVPLLESVGRVVAEDILASEPVPHFVRSTMDGYAVRARTTFGASEAMPVMLTLGGDDVYASAPILTGGALPDEFDAVVMLEYAELLLGGLLLVSRPVAVGENIMSVGEDVPVNHALVCQGQKLSIRDIAVLSALGHAQVKIRDFRVAVISSGDEIVPITAVPAIGQVRDINSGLVMGLIRDMGFQADFLGIMADDTDLLVASLATALGKYDAVIMSGGSSAGSHDYTARAMQKVGSPGVITHGLSIKPGKPTVLGVAGGKLMIGLPGHPLSCALTAHVVAAPLLAAAAGALVAKRTRLQLPLLQPIASVPGRRDIVTVKITQSGVYPLFAKSAAIRVLAESDGFIEINEQCEGLHVGERVEVEVWR
ncbi:MAG: molybdopterin-binding protein [Bacillota bacterium]|nr:molybdopterin-binding protein [Bacillota bacterium]